MNHLMHHAERDDYIGDDYIGDDYLGDDYLGDDYLGDDYLGDDYFNKLPCSIGNDVHQSVGHGDLFADRFAFQQPGDFRISFRQR